MSRSNYILFVAILACPALQAELSAATIQFLNSIARGAFTISKKLPDGSQIIEIAGKFPRSTELAKRAVKAAAKNPDKALITGAGILAAGKSIIEGKIAEEGINQGAKVVAKVKEAVEDKIAELNKEEDPKKETIETVQVGL